MSDVTTDVLDQKLGRLTEFLDDSPPTIDPARPCLVELAAGVVGPTGVRETQATVRELTGADEETLAGLSNSKTATDVDLIETLLKAGTVRLGSLDPTPELFGQLLIGDRDRLLLGIRTATFGNDLEMRYVCPGCQEPLHVTVDLEQEVPLRSLDDDLWPTFAHTLRDGRTVTCRIPVGADQRAVYRLGKGASVASMNTTLLSLVIMAVDDEPIVELIETPEEFARNLGMADRRALLERLKDAQPEPLYEEVKMPCPSCGRVDPLALSMADLFRV